MKTNRSTEATLNRDAGGWPITLKVDDGDIRTIRITPEEAAVLGRELIEAGYKAALPISEGELEVIITIKLEVKQ